MKISFKFENKPSAIFKTIKRPMVKIDIWSKKTSSWIEYNLLADTGADYTILPYHIAFELGVDLEKECKQFYTSGVGGTERVYLVKNGLKVRIGRVEKIIPSGFIERENIPPLLGRESCLNDFDIRFFNFTTTLTASK
mgnify:CR=1 FL=1